MPSDRLYIESEEVSDSSLVEMKRRAFILTRPQMGLSEGGLDPYYGGVQAVAREAGGRRGSADPHRDGAVVCAQPRSGK